MSANVGIVFDLDQLGFDPYGRVMISDRAAGARMAGVLEQADAMACHSGCGAPLSCDTALIAREELVRIGPDYLVNNPDFGTIIRKRKAVGAHDVVIVFSVSRKVDLDAAA